MYICNCITFGVLKKEKNLSPTGKSNCHLQNACFHFFLLGSVFLLMVVVKAEPF